MTTDTQYLVHLQLKVITQPPLIFFGEKEARSRSDRDSKSDGALCPLNRRYSLSQVSCILAEQPEKAREKLYLKTSFFRGGYSIFLTWRCCQETSRDALNTM